MFPHTNKMVFYWQRSHHEVVSMVTDAWAVCQTVRRSLTAWHTDCPGDSTGEVHHQAFCRQENLLLLLIHPWVQHEWEVLLQKARVPRSRPACWFSPRLGPTHLHARTPLPLHLQMCVNAEAREQTDGGDGVDLAISWEAGQEPESPLARAQGSMRAALWISQVSLLHWPQRAATIPRQTLWCSDEVTRPVHILGLVQSRHSQFEPKLDILQIKQHHLVCL